VVHWLPVSTPAADIEMVRRSSARVVRAAEALDDDDVAADCALPGWSRAELLTHLARNADGFRRIADGARAGEVADMYPGGAEERAADIAAGRGRPARAVLSDLRGAAAALDDAWRRLPDDRWSALGRTPTSERTVAETVGVRLRELEVHHVDLDVGYEPTDWPIAFVTRDLDDALRTLPDRAAPGRPELDAKYRVHAIDHGRSWIVVLHGRRVAVDDDHGATQVDATVSGWGCDLLAWLYGRNTGSDTVTASGHDVSALRLSTWFPYS
jgi:maleylpyruvate isomerase